MAFNPSGMLTRPHKIRVFDLSMQKMRSTRSTLLECCGKFSIYGHLELFFYFYLHWSSTVSRNSKGTASLLHSREGIKQGGPLAVVVYGIDLLPLTKLLKAAYPEITQPWNSNDAGALYTYENIELYFNLLK